MKKFVSALLLINFVCPIVFASSLRAAVPLGVSIVTNSDVGRPFDVDDEDPCPASSKSTATAGKTVPVRKALTKDQYVALATELGRQYGQKIDVKAKIDIDAMLLGSTRAAYGADLGATLLGLNQGPASIYLTAASAKKDPADTLVANNLGVELKVAKDLDRALSVLLYAHSLEADNTVVADNLAWVLLKLNDAQGAKALFENSVKDNPDDSEALAGLGFLAQCRGDNIEAAKFARRSLKNKYLSIAAATLNSAEGDINDDSGAAGGADENGNSTTAGPPKPQAPGTGKDFTAHEEPFKNPRGTEPGGLEWKDAPVDKDVERFIATDPTVQAWINQVNSRMEKASTDLANAATDMATTTGGSGKHDPNVLIYPNTYEKETFVLNDLERIFDARIRKITDEYAREFARLLPAPDPSGPPPSCLTGRPKAKTLHNQFFILWKGTWEKLRKELNDYHAFAAPWLADIHDPKLNALENASSDIFVRSQEAAMASTLQQWSIQIADLWAPTDDRCDRHPSETVPFQGTLQTLKKFPEKCYAPNIYMTVEVVTLETTCESLKIELGGKILAASAEYKFADKAEDDQVVLFVGAKASSKLKSLPGLEAGIKVGGEMVINASSREIVDYGVKATATAKFVVKPDGSSGGDATGEVKADARVGLKNPNGSFKPGYKFGFKGTL